MSILRHLTGINWIALLVAPLAVILMEAFWVYPWLIWLGKWSALTWQRTPLSLASLVFLLTLSFLVTRLMLKRRWQLAWLQLGIIGCGMVAILAVVRLEYGAGLRLVNTQWLSLIHI